MKSNNDTTKLLLAYYLANQFEATLLVNVCPETLQTIATDLTDMFSDLALSATDVKDCWKEWFSLVAYDGTLLKIESRYAQGSTVTYESPQMITAVAHKAIDSLK